MSDTAITRNDLEIALNDIVRTQDLKEELKRFATKQDLKEELKRFATKDDIAEIKQVLDYLRGHAVQMEFQWKAYTDIDTLHEERMDRIEERLDRIEKRLSLRGV